MFVARKPALARPSSVTYPISGGFAGREYSGVDIDIVQISASAYNPAAIE